MSAASPDIRIDPRPDVDEFGALWQAAWSAPWAGDTDAIWSRSLAHLGAYEGEKLIGYLIIAWDGGVHAFLLDTMVHPGHRRRGVATGLVQAAVAEARHRGAYWLHVDYEPHLKAFYAGCGFRPTLAGLIRLPA